MRSGGPLSSRVGTVALAAAATAAAAGAAYWLSCRSSRPPAVWPKEARAQVTAESLLQLLECQPDGDPAQPVDCEIGGVICRLVIRNRQETLRKLRSMMAGGASNLEVITDFDHTITRFESDGRRIPSSHGILESYPYMTGEDRKFLRDLYAKYYPIEICPDKSEEEKLPHMLEWWQSAHARLTDIKIQQSVLERTVDESGVMLRDGWRQLFDAVTRKNIPCLIFSAGVGDIIQEVLRQFDISGDQIRVVSNFMVFDDNGLLSGFTEPIIHTLNKRASAFAQRAAEAPAGRRNVLLLGDTLGDLRMSEGCGCELLLSVGFLNDKVEQRLASYAANFDIVCVQDPTLNVALAVLAAAAGPV